MCVYIYIYIYINLSDAAEGQGPESQLGRLAREAPVPKRLGFSRRAQTRGLC